jgi:hypothetical protein
MASTTLLTSITRSTTYPTVIAVSSTNNKGYISVDTSGWTEKMCRELPNIKFTIYTKLNSNDIKFEPFCITINTGNITGDTIAQTKVCESIYNIPSTFLMSIEPLFDNYSIKAHNELVQNGIIDDPIWDSETDTFNLEIKFITD